VNERLASFLARYRELSVCIQDPDLVKDQKKYRELMKEYSRMGDIAEASGELESLAVQLEDARSPIRGKPAGK
jgi:peptide chain release factor 1